MSTSIESLPNKNENENEIHKGINFSDNDTDYDSDISNNKKNLYRKKGVLKGVNQNYDANINQYPIISELPQNSLNTIIDGLATKISSEVSKKTSQQQQQQQQYQHQQQPLPSRDIPINTINYINDQETISSNINKEPQKDYINKLDNINNIANKAKQETNNYDNYLSYGVVSLLYIILQMPQIRRFFRNNIPKLFSEEGMPIFSYHILLAIIIGVLYFGIDNYVIRNNLLKV